MPNTGRRAHTRHVNGKDVPVSAHKVKVKPAAAVPIRGRYASRLQVAGEMGLSSLGGLAAGSLVRAFFSVTIALTVGITVGALTFVAWVISSKKRRRRHSVRNWRRKKVRRAKAAVRLGVYHGWKRLTGEKVMASTKRSGNKVVLKGLPMQKVQGPVNQHEPRDPSDLDQVTGEFGDAAKRVAARIRAANDKPSVNYKRKNEEAE